MTALRSSILANSIKLLTPSNAEFWLSSRVRFLPSPPLYVVSGSFSRQLPIIATIKRAPLPWKSVDGELVRDVKSCWKIFEISCYNFYIYIFEPWVLSREKRLCGFNPWINCWRNVILI